MPNPRRRRCTDNAGLDDETVYLMFMLHKYQRVSCRELAPAGGDAAVHRLCRRDAAPVILPMW